MTLAVDLGRKATKQTKKQTNKQDRESVLTDNFNRMWLHHLAGATIQIASKVNYNCHPIEDQSIAGVIIPICNCPNFSSHSISFLPFDQCYKYLMMLLHDFPSSLTRLDN